MTEIILHIGRHKTGTTSLQHFFSVNEALLLKRAGILYPQTGRDPWYQFHHPVFRSLIADGQGMDKDLVKGIMNEAEVKGAARILLSSEMLSRPTVTQAQLEEIRRQFADCPVSLIVYLRRQDTFLQSTYAERIKQGLLSAPDTIFNIDAALDYYQFIQKYASVFGADAMAVRSYDRAVKAGLYEDFLGVLGVKYDSQFVNPEKKHNERWPWSYLELVRHANASGWGRKLMTHHYVSGAAARLGRLFPTILDKPLPLTPREKESILRQYHDSNNKLAKEFMGQSELF